MADKSKSEQNNSLNDENLRKMNEVTKSKYIQFISDVKQMQTYAE